MRTRLAGFESMCPECFMRIDNGGRIGYDEFYERWVHEYHLSDPLEKTNPVCSDCFLTHPDGTECR